MATTTYTTHKAAKAAAANAALDACPRDQWHKLAKHFDANNFVTQVGPQQYTCDLQLVAACVQASHPAPQAAQG